MEIKFAKKTARSTTLAKQMNMVQLYSANGLKTRDVDNNHGSDPLNKPNNISHFLFNKNKKGGK